jgi:hypothetical protein
VITKGGRRKAEDGKYGKYGKYGRPLFRAVSLPVSLAVFLLPSSVFLGCGKKGPPLAPLNMGPEAPKDVSGRRLGDTVYLQMIVPSKNLAGVGPYSVDRLEVYAVTIPPGSPFPPNRDVLKPAHMIAKIPVRPPVDPDAPEPDEAEKAKETRPRPGDTFAFIDKLTEGQLTPTAFPAPPAPKVPTPKTAKSGEAAPPPPPAAAAAGPTGPTVLTRMYIVRGVAKNGNVGLPSQRVQIPLLAPPGRARGGSTTWNESSIVLTWEPPPTSSDEEPGVLYNVYSSPPPNADQQAVTAGAPVPLNDKPLTTTTFVQPGAAAGKEQCFVVRAVAPVGTAFIEGDATDPICVTPKDTFPPAAPKGLTAVGGAGAIDLIWDANTEPDLAGYVVLRGEAPGDTLQPLTPQPIRETRFSDTSAKVGVTYAYVVIAVDKAGNRSAASNRVQETAR